jgi:hypothetical protein
VLPIGKNQPTAAFGPQAGTSGSTSMREMGELPLLSGMRSAPRSERLPRSQYVLNEGVTIGVCSTPAYQLNVNPVPLPLGGIFSFSVPTVGSPSSRPGSPQSTGRRKTMEDIVPLAEIEKQQAVKVETITPRGETAVKVGGAKALTAFFDQFCELSA